MRQVHKAGEKMFVDFAGQRPKIVDPKTGDVTEVELFVAVLGASSFTYAEATASQQAPHWIRAHTNALEYFGGSPRVYVPDNLKSAVTEVCRYEPKIQRTYEEMARHYGAVVIPARAYKPKDKAKAEVGVQVAERCCSRQRQVKRKEEKSTNATTRSAGSPPRATCVATGRCTPTMAPVGLSRASIS